MRRLALLAISLVLPFTAAAAQEGGEPPISLHPGDVVRVDIWREKDLSGDFLVDETGTVTLPLIGPKRVSGVPIAALRDTLLNAYRANLRNPSINITPLRRVNVLGEVTKPGQYPIDPTVSLVGAVAMAGGATPLGDLRRVRVTRNGVVVGDRLDVGRSLNSLDVRSGDIIYVDRRSWADRNSPTLLASALSLVGAAITTLIIVGR